MSERAGWPRELLWSLAVALALIPLAWVPRLPIAGAQLSDAMAVGAVAYVLAVATARGQLVVIAGGRVAFAALAVFIGWAAVSTAATGGSMLRLAGTCWLGAFGLGVATMARDAESSALVLRRALVAAAAIGAVTGLVGAALFAVGEPTALLNHAGDLVPGNYPRIRGTMMRANGLASILVLGIVLAADVPRRWRAAVVAVCVVALVFTFSRTWIALTAGIGVYVLALGTTRSRTRDLLAVAVVVSSVVAMLASAWLGIQLDPTRPWDVSISDEPGTRLVHLRAALDTIAAHPLLGVGSGRFADPTGWDAHFALANVAATMGIPAAVAFAALVGFALQRAVVAARAGDVASRGVAAALVVFCVDALARDIEDQRALWALIGLAFAASVRDRRATRRRDLDE